MRLRLHRDDNPENDAPAPLPFPRDRAAPGRSDDRRARSQEDTASAADAALDDLQRGIDELEELLDTLPFPAQNQDDGPYAA